MTEPIYPVLPGLTFPVERVPIVQTRIQRAVSGRELRAPDYPYPLRQFNLVYEFLRDKPSSGLDERRTLEGFWLSLATSAGTFLFDDPDDDSVTGQGIAVGNGSATAFQLARGVGSYLEPITAPNIVSHVKVDGVDSGGWSVDPLTGIVTVGSPPAFGALITADFTYYFRCRFVDDSLTLSKFMHQYWEAKRVSIISVRP